MARRFWGDVGAILLIALTLAPILLYGQLQASRDRASITGPNDGRQSTFFAFYSEPFYVFSEDFHLYVLRAKRIVDRGWVDDLFDSEFANATTRKNYLQYLIGRLMLITDGEPVKYSILSYLISALPLFLLYCCLKISFGRELGLIGCLFVAVIYGAFAKYAAAFDLLRPWLTGLEPTVWPGFRLLRLSTFAWSSGALAALAVLAASVAAAKERVCLKQGAIAALLLLFALGDVWSFVLALCIIAAALIWRLSAAVRSGVLAGRGLSDATTLWLRDIAPLLVLSILIGLLFRMLSGETSVEVLARAGLGPEWRSGGFTLTQVDEWLLGFLVRSVFLLLPLGGMFILLRGWRRPGVFLVAGFALAGLPLVLAAAQWFGAHPYQMIQFYDRVEMILFLAFLIVLVHAGRSLFGAALDDDVTSSRARWSRRVTAAFALSMVLLYVPLSAVRTDLFIRQVAAQHAALPLKLERLRIVLACLDGEILVQDVASLSPDINHLVAFWTDADLRLPVGFPLHNAGSNSEIESRMAVLLQIYRVEPEAWRVFPINAQGDSTVSWRRSRLLAARQGYIYFLFHHGGPRRHREKVESIAQHLGSLGHEGKAPPRPQVIIEDEVSRFLGRPDLSGYTSIWRADDLALWLRDDGLAHDTLRRTAGCSR